MIIINRKPSNFYRREGNQENIIYYVNGLVNWHVLSRPSFFHPPTDVLETPEKFIVRVEISGIDNENFSITFDQSILSIEGIRKDPLEKRSFHQMEVQFGEFSSIIELHASIDSDKITAEYQDGFLMIELPKKKSTTILIEEEH